MRRIFHPNTDGQRKKRKFQLGDEVKIKVKNVDLSKRQIDFLLQEEKQHRR